MADGVLFLPALSVRAQQPVNVQILTGMSRPEVERVMNQMRAGVGVHCHHCHTRGDAASDAKPQKLRALEMMRMVIDLNARHFGGKRVVTCFTCHDGKPRPALVPPLPQAVPPEAAAVEAKPLPAVAAAVIQKYVQAVGRELTPATPRLFQGTYKSPAGPAVPATILDAGKKLRVDLQWPDGSMLTRTIDSNSGWLRDRNGVRDMTPEDRLRAHLFRRAFAPFHTSSLGDDARVVDSDRSASAACGWWLTPTARYSFDAETGHLLRRVVHYDSPVGRIPEQTDFEDYRDVDGVKVPLLIRAAPVDPWLGGTQQAETIRIGPAVAAGEFEKPATS